MLVVMATTMLVVLAAKICFSIIKYGLAGYGAYMLYSIYISKDIEIVRKHKTTIIWLKDGKII